APGSLYITPSITETLFAAGLGERIIGRTQQCDWPLECNRIPAVGGFSTVTAEKIYTMKPDLVIGTTLHTRIFGDLKKHGSLVATIPPYPAFKAHAAIKCIGMVVGATLECNNIAKQVETEITNVKNNVSIYPSKTVCYLCNIKCPSWYDCNIASSIEFLNCKLAGRKKAAGKIDDDAIIKNITKDRPELILVPQCSRCREECINRLLSTNNELSSYIRQNRIPVITFASKLIARNGPRSAQALMELTDSLFNL
ncbi:MAG TPA: ABC transporter substrate-binding protein, partial [Chitinispirillaceae bacterium]|nr:ABC transporter substrate-binding protein [Chitinispirillaceae bacterium]